jgi:hypothetical protein
LVAGTIERSDQYVIDGGTVRFGCGPRVVLLLVLTDDAEQGEGRGVTAAQPPR